MEKKLLNYVKVFLILTFISILLLIALLLCDVVFVAHTPSYIVPSAPTSSLEIRVQNLEMGLQSLQRDLVSQLNHKLYYFGGIALLISGVAAFLGWRTFKDLDELIQEKIRATLENELYQLDPANLTIRLPETHSHTKDIRERLELSGLKKLKSYKELNKYCKYGLTIVPVENEEAEKDFKDFLKREKPDPEYAAFVLYASNFYKVDPFTLKKYPRLATANMPSTVITAILAIARGLHRETDLKKKD